MQIEGETSVANKWKCTEDVVHAECAVVSACVHDVDGGLGGSGSAGHCTALIVIGRVHAVHPEEKTAGCTVHCASPHLRTGMHWNR